MLIISDNNRIHNILQLFYALHVQLVVTGADDTETLIRWNPLSVTTNRRKTLD